MSTPLDNLKLHYWTDINGSTTLGRGEFIALLLIDAGVKFEYVKFSDKTWRENKQKFIEEGCVATSLPYVQTADGQYFSNTLPSMRYISRKLGGKYDGKTDEEKYLVDNYADTMADWYIKWVNSQFSKDEEASKKYKEEYLVEQLNRHEKYLSKSTGPYLLGDEPTYADFYLFHTLEDNDMPIDAERFPHLTAFVKAFGNRPNMKKYLASDRK
ncbi:MAG: glutathione S-transferase [Benjaminiella poitrasii]|nr:MAG: glutathione S-transferase [Benjaminiella poitrasii]